MRNGEGQKEFDEVDTYLIVARARKCIVWCLADVNLWAGVVLDLLQAWLPCEYDSTVYVDDSSSIFCESVQFLPHNA